MTRTDALRAIEAAGTANDHRAFARLYAENRVALDAAKAAFAKGANWAKFVQQRDARTKEG